MSRQHVDRSMAAYLEDQLPDSEREAVSSHLQSCTRCRTRLEEVARGATLAARLGAVEPPPCTIQRLEAVLRADSDTTAEARQPVRLRMPGSAWQLRLAWSVAVILALAASLWWWPPRVTFQPASGSPGSLEEIALAAFNEPGRSRAQDLETDSPTAVRAWLKVRDLSAALAVERRESFRLRGVTDVSRPGLTAAAVRYTIDGHEAVLVTARASQVADAPRWGVFGKRVRFQASEDGAKLLTWSNSGKAYTLISKLPHRGERSCLICHTDPRRQRLIATLSAGS